MLVHIQNEFMALPDLEQMDTGKELEHPASGRLIVGFAVLVGEGLFAVLK